MPISIGPRFSRSRPEPPSSTTMSPWSCRLLVVTTACPAAVKSPDSTSPARDPCIQTGRRASPGAAPGRQSPTRAPSATSTAPSRSASSLPIVSGRPSSSSNLRSTTTPPASARCSASKPMNRGASRPWVDPGDASAPWTSRSLPGWLTNHRRPTQATSRSPPGIGRVPHNVKRSSESQRPRAWPSGDHSVTQRPESVAIRPPAPTETREGPDASTGSMRLAPGGGGIRHSRSSPSPPAVKSRPVAVKDAAAT